MVDKKPSIEYPYFITSLWGGTPDDPNLEGPVNAVLSGVTSTHIADTLYTTNKKSFDKAKRAGIPAKEFIDADGNTAYEIHFSFGPDNNGLGSMLDDSYLTNCLNAQLITPVSKNDLKNNENYKTNKVNSMLDLLKIFTSKIYLYPLFNCTHPAELEKDDIKAFDAAIHKALEKYVQSERDDKSRSTYFKEVDAALTQLQESRDPNYGVEGREMTKNQFLYWFNQNIGTIGLEPKTKVKTALISEEQSQKGEKGFVEERFVNKMVRIKHSMDGKRYSGAMSLFNPLIKLLYSYNFVLLNCSHTVTDIHLESANDSRIRDELRHTIGWNDIEKVINSTKQYGFFSEKTGLAMARIGIGVLEFITMRAIETPANSVYNLRAAIKLRDTLNQEAPGQKPKPQPAPKVVPEHRVHHKPKPTELKPRLSHPKLRHSLTLKLKNTSLMGLVENAQKSKVAMQVFFDQRTDKPIAAVFYSDKNKNVPIATVDLKPNNSNTVNIKFGDLPLDQHQILALLNVLKQDVKINKDSDKPVIFTIEHKQALHDARTLQSDIQKVFGKNASVEMKAAEPARSFRQPRIQ
jgi:hypothetical protein